MWKTINSGIDIGIRYLLPDLVENEIIDLKDNLINLGLKDGIKKSAKKRYYIHFLWFLKGKSNNNVAIHEVIYLKFVAKYGMVEDTSMVHLIQKTPIFYSKQYLCH